MQVHIRWMIRRDLPEVLSIESRSFRLPWSRDEFLDCLRQRNCIGHVAEYSEHVLGYVIYELHRTRIHIANFAVDPEYRRQKVATQMFDKIKKKLNSRRNKISMEVADAMLDTHLFLRAIGFKATEVIRGHDCDAYAFEFTRNEPASVA